MTCSPLSNQPQGSCETQQEDPGPQKWAMSGASIAQQEQWLLVMQASRIGASVPVMAALFLNQFPANVLRKIVENEPSAGPLPPTWETDGVQGI